MASLTNSLCDREARNWGTAAGTGHAALLQAFGRYGSVEL